MDKKLTEFERLFQESESDPTNIEQKKYGRDMDVDDYNYTFQDVEISLDDLNEKNQKAIYKKNGLQDKRFHALKKLKSKSLPHAIIDLHAQPSTIQGLKTLNNFFKDNYHKHQYFKIIHGKGLHNNKEISPMRNLVRKFLLNNPEVLAFTPAQNNDGGDGVTYVLIKK